jgi:hypothetical protein
MRLSRLSKPQSTFAHADESTRSDHQMIKHIDVEQPSGFDDLTGYDNILWRRGWVATRMVVHNNNRC